LKAVTYQIPGNFDNPLIEHVSDQKAIPRGRKDPHPFEKQDAPTVNLAEAPELKVEEALPPANVPADISRWLKPRERLSYFFSSDTN